MLGLNYMAWLGLLVWVLVPLLAILAATFLFRRAESGLNKVLALVLGFIILSMGYDVIEDADGLGKLMIGSIEAKGKASVTNPAKWIQLGNVWQDQEHGITYGLAPLADGSQTFLITDLNGSTVEVKGWSDGELGIDLGTGAPLAAVPATSLTLTGDLEAADQDSGASGIQEGYDDLGNLKVTDTADPDREDTLYDSIDNDHILGLGGSDYIYTHRGGDNVLEGGEGSDVVMSLGGNEDLLIGGGGNDDLYGDQHGYAPRDWTATRSVMSSGDVTTYATEITNGTRIEAAIGAADVIYGGTGEDWIEGGQDYGKTDGLWREAA